MVSVLSIPEAAEMFQFVGERVIEHKELLTEIDSAIGDGDHGVGMSLGFTAAIKRLNEVRLESINDVFSVIGHSMITTMGGASGVIFGTMFTGGVKNLPAIDSLDLETLTSILENALMAVKARGKADVGDKTMIDALEPAVMGLRASIEQGSDLLEALKRAEESAKVGMENTKGQLPKFGRAKSLGERAVGFQDAGATSVWLLFCSMREWVERFG